MQSRTGGFILLALCVALCASASTRTRRNNLSERVGAYLLEASSAWEHLEESNLAGMEAVLTRGYREIEAMVGSSPPDQRTLEFLKARGWGQLVWTQIVLRLIAIRNGLYDQELRFAERVVLESEARSTLSMVETSIARLHKLLEAKDRFRFDDQIDPFARSMLDPGHPAGNWEQIIDEFQERFARRKQAVIARLESGRRRGIIDPSGLPTGTRHAALYERHRDRLEDENGRLDAIILLLARYDRDRLRELVEIIQTTESPETRADAAGELKVLLLSLEDALGATEKDPEVLGIIAFLDSLGHLAFNPHEGYFVGMPDLAMLVRRAERNLDALTRPPALRALYAVEESVR